MKKIIAATSLALCIGVVPFAQAANPFAEISAARVKDTVGAEVGFGAKLKAGDFALKPQLVAFVYDGETPGFETQTQRNGSTICRNTSNGQYAEDSNCVSMKVSAALKLELTYAMGAWGELGVGARVDKETRTPYVAYTKAVSPSMALKLSGGRDYVGLGLVFGR